MNILLIKSKIMKKDFSNFYIKLAVLAGMGMAFCFWLRPEKFIASDVLSWFYIVLMFVFFRMNIDSVAEKQDFQIANWFALLGIEASILLNLNFWLTPVVATVAASSYFLFRAWVWRKKIVYAELWRSALWITVFNYVLVAVIKFLLVPAWHWLFR